MPEEKRSLKDIISAKKGVGGFPTRDMGETLPSSAAEGKASGVEAELPPQQYIDRAGLPIGGEPEIRPARPEAVSDLPGQGPLAGSEHTLDDCARILINQLPEARHQEQIMAIIQDRGIPPAQMVLGILILYSETAAFSEVRVEQFIEEAGEVLERQEPGNPVVEGVRTKTCSICHGMFIPTRSRQLYCCNACGVKADGGTPLMVHTEKCQVVGA